MGLRQSTHARLPKCINIAAAVAAVNAATTITTTTTTTTIIIIKTTTTTAAVADALHVCVFALLLIEI